MSGMQGWPSHIQLPTPEPAAPPPSVGRLGGQNGSTSLSFGLVAFLLGGLLLVFTVRNPSFDPSSALRAPIGELGAGLDVPEPGDYVAYVESSCGLSSLDLVQNGQPAQKSSTLPSNDFVRYTHEGSCGVPIGVYTLPTSGEWKAVIDPLEGGNVALYSVDDPPTYVVVGPVVVGALLVLLGAFLLARGAVQQRRWKRVVQSLE